MTSHTKGAWKKAFWLAHLRCQRQISALGVLKEPMSGAHGVFPPAGQNMSQLETALGNLALEVATDSAILQQLTLANLSLTTINAVLTTTNKTWVDSAVKARAAVVSVGTTGGKKAGKPLPNSYCWTHGHKVYGLHSSATCGTKAVGHHVEATKTNTLGGSEKNKGWESAQS